MVGNHRKLSLQHIAALGTANCVGSTLSIQPLCLLLELTPAGLHRLEQALISSQVDRICLVLKTIRVAAAGSLLTTHGLGPQTQDSSLHRSC